MSWLLKVSPSGVKFGVLGGTLLKYDMYRGEFWQQITFISLCKNLPVLREHTGCPSFTNMTLNLCQLIMAQPVKLQNSYYQAWIQDSTFKTKTERFKAKTLSFRTKTKTES